MEIYYTTSEGKNIYLDRKPYYMLDSSDVIDYEWEYQTNSKNRQISAFTKNLKKKGIDIAIISESKEEHKENINNIVEAFENNIVMISPGKLNIGEYYLSCYFVKSKKQSIYENAKKAIVNFSVVVEKDVWIKKTRHEFIHEDIPDISGRGYPYGYEYDYSIGSGYMDILDNEHFASCDFILEIRGYSFKPSITIGGHVYKVNETIQANEILTIDSKEKTIILTKNNGVKVNLFSKREKSSYIFEKIHSGENQVYWNSGFNFEITLFEERSEPKWT